MKSNWKLKVARMTGENRKLDKKLLRMKSSWDEVQGILNSTSKKKKK